VVLHGSLIAVLVYGWWHFHQQSRPIPTLAIDATVVDGKALNRAQAPAKAAPPAPAPPPAPQPTPDDQTVAPAPKAPSDAQREAEKEKLIAQQREAEQARADAERKAQEQAQRNAREAERKAQQEAERKAQDLAERKAREAEEAKERARQAEQVRLAEAKRRSEEQRKEQETQQAKETAEVQEDLQRGLAEEQRVMAERNGSVMANWTQQITARIQHAWIRPPTAREGLDCTLYVTQVPGGQIVNVKLGECNGDDAVRQSIQDAAYRASPLPPPPDPALFERNLVVEFKPTD